MPSRVENLPQEYQPPLISDRSRWYSEDPIPIIYLIDRANDRRESDRPASRSGRWFLPGRWQCIARGSVGSPPLIGSWATATTAVAIRRCGQVVGLAEWHMLPSWLPPTYVPECLLLACWGLGLATLWPLCSSQLRRPVTDVEPQRRLGPFIEGPGS